MKSKIVLMILLVVVLIIVAGFSYWIFQGNEMLTNDNHANETPQPSIRLVNFSEVNSEFSFSANIPAEWQVEYIPQLRAINIYNPALAGNNIERSQLYLTFFKASRFLTLSTVDISRQDATTVNGHGAVIYEITKKAQVSNFAGQPSWRNSTHTAIDIRASQESPTYFYSFAKNPSLSEKIFNNIISSLVFTEN